MDPPAPDLGGTSDGAPPAGLSREERFGDLIGCTGCYLAFWLILVLPALLIAVSVFGLGELFRSGWILLVATLPLLVLPWLIFHDGERR